MAWLSDTGEAEWLLWFHLPWNVFAPNFWRMMCVHVLCGKAVWTRLGSLRVVRSISVCPKKWGRLIFFDCSLKHHSSFIMCVSDLCCTAGQFVKDDVYVSLYGMADLCGMAGWFGQLQINRQGESSLLWIVFLGTKCGFLAQIDVLYILPLANRMRFLQCLLLCVQPDLCPYAHDGCFNC